MRGWLKGALVGFILLGWGPDALVAPSGWRDAAWAYGRDLSVSTGTAGIPTSYTTSVTFDHAALVTAGKSRADGNDVRIVYWNGASWIELDRFLDPGSSWNSTTTTLWFRTQAAVGASSSDANYRLHYGNNAAGSPPSSPANVFFFYDGYESGDFSGWGTTSAGTGDTNTVVTSPVWRGSYSAEAFVDGDAVSGSFARVENNFAGQSALHSTLWVYVPATYTGTDDIAILQFYTGGWASKVASVSIRAPLGDMRLFIANFNPSPAEFYFGTTPVSTGAWHRVEMKIDVVAGRGEV